MAPVYKRAMDQIVKIKDMVGVVRRLLTKHPELRDCDKRLVAHVWKNQIGGYQKLEAVNMLAFLTTYCNTELIASPDSITRARRKVQELQPELRGASYRERHKQAGLVRESIKNV